MIEIAVLRTLAKRYPNIAAVLAELANLRAVLTLPKPTVHVVSDVHGEHVKLRQVVNNASGALRPRVERLLAGRDQAAIDQFLATVYYPHETWLTIADRPAALRAFVDAGVIVMRDLAQRYSIKYVEKVIPDPFDPVFRELLFGGDLGRAPGFVTALLAPFAGREVELVRTIAHVIRNLAVGELIIAGDLGDRGPRIDKVIDIAMQQPTVAITWGNHDADWMAACLGHPAAIATVVRLSLRYQRLAQLEDGYGISLRPLEELAREVYGADPAACFELKGEASRDPLLLARMQKAIAILQFKLEGQLFRRRPEWGLQDRALLERIDPKAWTVDLAGTKYPLRDTAFPTVDWRAPNTLAPAEQRCLDALTAAFVASGTLWRQMQFVVARGSMWLRRDRCAIFHGCLPVDAQGELVPMLVDGEPRTGRALFEALDVVVRRAFRTATGTPQPPSLDTDTIFYLWTGPRSPCFGKDKMATFETYFIADKATHEEVKNPYFKLIHDGGFCARILEELGVDPVAGFIINGHVPVKLEQGEAPIKKSGRAITIDGAFAAAYGDKGFSLVLDAGRMYLAQHHHFESADAAVSAHADIVPTVSDVCVYDPPRTVGDTETGDAIRAEIAVLEQLVSAFETNLIAER